MFLRNGSALSAGTQLRKGNLMKKRGLGPVVSTVLLIAVALVIAGIIFAWGWGFMSRLSPPVNCDNISFQAEISLNESGEYNLNVVNQGNQEITGFVIKEITEGSVETVEEINYFVDLGRTESISLSGDYQNGKYLVVPKTFVEVDEEGVSKTCQDKYGIEVEI